MSNTVKTLVKNLKKWNTAYYKGKPLVTDIEYDKAFEQLRSLEPDHPYLSKIDDTALDGKGDVVVHGIPMLSLSKAYAQSEIQNFVNNVEKAAKKVGVKARFRVTPKLDGVAGNDDGTILSTRGNGRKGSNITHVFKRGVVCLGKRGQGRGEIVMVQSYFEKNFKDDVDHPRNMVVGAINADVVKSMPKKALKDKKIHFVPYTELAKTASWEGTGKKVIADIEKISEDLRKKVDYPLDGMVIDAIDPKIHEEMGSTNSHNRWQLAYKQRGETAKTVIEEIGWQTGRTGVVTPVLRVRPVSVSGATISNITAHNAGVIRDHKLGPGAKIEVIRSGEVIPKLEKVLKSCKKAAVISECPACSSKLRWRNDFLICENHTCPAKIQTQLYYWFKTLGNCDGFGPKTIEVLQENDCTTIKQIYKQTVSSLQDMGFGKKTAQNLVGAMKTSRSTAIEDARFLAAFGIPHLGLGDSRKILSKYKLSEAIELSASKIEVLPGFAEKTSTDIARGLSQKRELIKHMMGLYTSIEDTQSVVVDTDSPISGKVVMFTGAMDSDRDEMKAQAKSLGARVLTSVSGKLEILIIGKKASAKKIAAAEAENAQVITEQEYYELLKD